MKLHLPSGLRKALIAVLSALPVSTVAVATAAATASAYTPADIQAIVDAYNANAADNRKIYHKTYASGEYNCTNLTNISVTETAARNVDIAQFVNSATTFANNGYYLLTGSSLSVSGDNKKFCNGWAHWKKHTGVASATITFSPVNYYYLGGTVNLAVQGLGLGTESPAQKDITIGAMANGSATKADLTATAVSLAANQNVVVQANSTVTATTGNVELKGAAANTIQTGAVVTANNGNIKLGDGKQDSATHVEDWALVEYNWLASKSNNTISGSTVTAGGKVDLETASGNNIISGSTVTAGNGVTLSSKGAINMNTAGSQYASIIFGSHELLMPGDNSITSSTVTATNGNASLTGMSNTITGSKLKAENGAVELNAVMGNTISGTNTEITAANGITVGSTTTYGGSLLGYSLDIDINTFINEVNSGKLVANGGNITVQGLLNTVGDGNVGATLESKQGSIYITGTPQNDFVNASGLEGIVANLVLDKVANNAGFKETLKGFGLVTTDEEGNEVVDTDLLKLLMQQSGNIIDSGSKLVAADDVTLSGVANLVRSSTLQAGSAEGDKVTIDGGLNAMLGATILGNEVEFKTSNNNTIHADQLVQLLPMVEKVLGDVDFNGIGMADLNTLVGSLPEGILDGKTASANVLVGGQVSDVDNSAADKVKLTGTANAIMGGTDVYADEIILDGVDTKLPLSALAKAALANDKLKAMVSSKLPAGITLDMLTPMLDSSAMGKLEKNFSANLVYGGGTHLGYNGTDEVTMTALGNLVAKNAQVLGHNVTMTGLGNVVALGATVKGGTAEDDTVTMDGMANLVYDGTVTGNSITMGMSADNKYINLLTPADMIGILPGQLGDYNISSIKDALTSFTGNVQLGPVNVNMVVGHNALVGGDTTGSVTMNGTANVLIAGATVKGNTVTMNGTANMVLGGADVLGTNIVMQGTPLSLLTTSADGAATAGPLGTLAGSLLNSNLLAGKLPLDKLPAGTTDILTSVVDKVSDNLSVNLVYGGISHVGDTATQTVTMSALGNIVAQNAAVTAQDVTMTGLANIVALKANNGDGAVVNGINSVKMDGMLNVVYDGGRVTGGNITMGMTSANPYSSTLTLDELAASIPNSMITGMLGSSLGTMAGSFKDALPGLITSYGPGYFNMNLVMGQNALVSGNSVSMGGIINMLSDRAKVHGNSKVDISGFTNVVTDGASVSTNGYLSMAGTLNFVSHLTLADAESLLQTGKLPNRTITTTTLTSTGNMDLWGTANVLLGDVKVESKGGNVQMGGMNDPILGFDSLTIDQCVELAGKMGLDLNKMTTDGDTTIAQLLEMAGKSGDAALVAEAKAALKNVLTNYKGVEIPSELLSSNVNVVMEGAVVHALNGAVTMNGTANLMSGNAWVQGQTVTMNGMGNAVIGGANLVGTDVVMHGVDQNLHLGAMGALLLDNSAQLNELVSGLPLPEGMSIGALLETMNTVNGSVNLVYGGSTNVRGTNTVTMDALANIVAKNAHVDGDNKVTMRGALNLVSTGAEVKGKNISILGSGKSFITWDNLLTGEYAQLLPLLNGVDLNANVVADGALLKATDRLWMDGTANIIMGGADLSAKTIDIISGGVNVVADTSLQNVADLLGGNMDGFLTGSTDETTLTATGNLTMSGLANIVNGGRVSLHAGKDVNLKGALNLVGGGKSADPNIYAEGDVNMIGSNTIQLKPSTFLSTGYAALDKVFDKVTEEGVSLNLVAGGAKVEAGNNITMSGMLSAVVDTTLSNVKDAINPDGSINLEPLIAGGVHATTLTAGNDIIMDSKLNLVNGGMVSLNAGKDVTLRGVMNYVGGDAQVNATNGTVTLTGAANAVLMGADIEADRIILKRNDSLTETMNGVVNSFVPGGVSQNVCVSAGVVAGEGTSLKANSYLHLNDNLNLVAEGAQLSSNKLAHIEGTANVVMTGAAVSGKDVLMHGSFGNAVLDGATLTANNGDITLQAPGLDEKDVKIAGAVADSLQGGFLGNTLSTLLPDNSYVALLQQNAQYLKPAAELLTLGGLNVVAGGADLKAEKGSIAMDGGVNVVIDTTLGNLVEAIKGDTSSLLAGGTDETTLTAGKDITLSGLANVVNGGKVKLNATETVTLYGAGNVISGNAQVSGKNVTLRGSGRTDIVWADMLPVENEVLSKLLQQYDPNVNVVANGAQLKAGERLWMDATANVIMGGADLSAKTIDIVSGGVNVVADTTLQNVVDAINPDGSINLEPLIAGGTNETTLKGNNITLSGLANVVNGGKVRVDATNNVTIKGAGNVISGNAQVSGKNVTLKDSDNGHDWSSLLTGTEYAQLGSLLKDRNPNVNVMANGAKVTATETLSVNGGVNVVMGGAALKGDTVSLSAGVANVLVDTKLQNINDALQSGSLDSLMAGGSDTTTVTATENLALYGAGNVVNGKVALSADSVSITGAANMIGGGATVDAKNVTMNGRDFAMVGELLEVLPSQYQNLAERLGVEALGSANVVMSGADVHADNNVQMSGGLNVVTDATMGDMLTLVDKDNTTWPGEGAATTVSADKNISMKGKANVVMGDKALVDAGNNVTMNGTAAIVTADAVVKAANDIELNTASQDNGLLGDIADKVLESPTMNKIADAFLPNHEDLAGKLNTYGNINVVTDGATLDAGRDVKFNSSMNVVDTATVMAGNNIAFNGGKTEVTKATLSAGNQVVISGGAGASTYSSRTTIDSDFTMTGGRMEAENGLIVKDNANASISQAELVLGGTSSVEAGSTLSLADLTVNPGAQIVNYGTLSLNDVVMTNVTVSNVGTMTVTGPLTMDNVALNYSGIIDTMASSAGAIGLDGNGALTLASTSVDAISSVSFVVDSALLADAFDTAKEFSFVLFTNATNTDYTLVNQNLALSEFHVGVANSSWNTTVTSMNVAHVDGNIVVTATVMVPEPTTATLSLLALAGLAARRRRRH